MDALLGVQATLVEVAAHFHCSEDTIERAVERDHGMGFAEYRDKKSGTGKLSLRRKQFALALGGPDGRGGFFPPNVTMLIWLGKQYLGQADRAELTGKDGGPIETRDVDDTRTAERAAAILRRAEMRKLGAV